MSALVMNLYYPQLPVGRGLTEGITMSELDAVEELLDRSRHDVSGSRSGRADAPLLTDETAFGADLVGLLVRDARARISNNGTISSVPATMRAGLAAELDDLIDRYRALWLARNRPGGLDDSLAWLQNLRAAYESGRPSPTWGGLRAPAR
jgi:hypothetical protein